MSSSAKALCVRLEPARARPHRRNPASFSSSGDLAAPPRAAVSSFDSAASGEIRREAYVCCCLRRGAVRWTCAPLSVRTGRLSVRSAYARSSRQAHRGTAPFAVDRVLIDCAHVVVVLLQVGHWEADRRDRRRACRVGQAGDRAEPVRGSAHGGVLPSPSPDLEMMPAISARSIGRGTRGAPTGTYATPVRPRAGCGSPTQAGPAGRRGCGERAVPPRPVRLVPRACMTSVGRGHPRCELDGVDAVAHLAETRRGLGRRRAPP